MSLNDFGYKVPTNADLNFWYEHIKNTCCDMTNVDFLRGKVGWIKLAGREVSDQCVETSSKMFWSLCDGGVGTGQLTGICPEMCSNWYNSCRYDYFSGDSRASELGAGEITFCNKNSMTCSQLNDIYDDSRQFCEQMGISVNDDKDTCYNGTPWALTHGRAKTNGPKSFKESKKSRKGKSSEQSYADILLGPLSEFYHEYPTFFLAFHGFMLFSLVAYGVSFWLSMRQNKQRLANKVDVDEKIRQKRLKQLEKKQKLP